MKNLILTLLFLLNLSVWAQSNAQTYNGLKGWTDKPATSIENKVQNRNVRPYDALRIEGDFEVILYRGEEGKIELSGPQSLLEEVEVENTSNGLRIKYATQWKKMFKSQSKNSTVRVRIPFESLSSVSLSGSGRIQTEDTLQIQQFKAQLSGSGKIELDLDTRQTTVSLSGSGRLELHGQSENLSSRLAGSGIIDCKNLKTQSSDASLSGSGHINLHSLKSINSSIAGSGNVSVYGSPPKVKSKTAGSGKIKLIER